MRKLNLLMDFYELTMANAYFKDQRHEEIAVFDVFFRRIPDDGGYAVFAGLEQIVEYLQHLSFSEKEIDYLKSKNIFDEKFLSYLETFSFSSDVYSVKEGTPIFPTEPILIVSGPLIECQLIETMVLLTINHQSLIATKTARIVSSAKGRTVMEFGARRAHGYDAANYGARASYIAGTVGSSNVYTDFKYGIPALGTMAHSFVQSYETEYEAFKKYAENYPDATVLLVDTYDTLRQGIPNAIKIHHEVLKPKGHYLKGIRLDSGDLAYLSIKARRMLDEAGLTETKITASNSLDEYAIKDLLYQGAKIDSFGVGERLITARSEAVFGGVYKIAALINPKTKKYDPKIKISDTVEKTTIPGFKQVFRMYDKKNKAIADVIALHDEKINPNEPYLLFDPVHIWKEKEITDYDAVPILHQIFSKGKLVYKLPSLTEIRSYHQAQMETLWDEVKRLEKPHRYYVDLSKPLWDLQNELREKSKSNVKN